MRLRFVFIISISISLAACAPHSQAVKPASVAFNADSAYEYVAAQMRFGPRVPTSEAHQACGDWLMSELERHGWKMEEQLGEMTNYAGQKQPVRNIIGHLTGNQHDTTRILLGAHWDCRPWCDEEPEYEHRFDPVPGANDGASGVGVLLEIARQLTALKKDTAFAERVPSVDIVFFDCEDMGAPDHYTGPNQPDDWCLGSQLWASTYTAMPSPKARYRYGIVLDMVGDPSASFPREYISMQYAAPYVEALWRQAMQLGYSRYFLDQSCYPITDDHLYVNRIAGIPCVDIIDYKPGSETGFPLWWHTHDDTMQNINNQTLQAVGLTVLTTICSK